MQWRILIISIGLAFTQPLWARPAGNFGFGKPPTFRQTQSYVNEYLANYLKDSRSVQGLTIARPVAGCYGHGMGRRDVCGYLIFVAYNAKNSFGAYVGRKVYAYWVLNGWGLQVFENKGGCPQSFDNWSGTPAVELPDFCDFQPKHPDCSNGRKEEYAQSLVPERLNGNEPESSPHSICTAEMRDKMIEQHSFCKFGFPLNPSCYS
jgi:hypothetical protein